MDSTQDSAPTEPVLASSRWGLAIGGSGNERKEALEVLAASYWYCAYAWWRRAGMEPAEAATATLACFTRWLGDFPPQADDSGSARMREWLPARLAELSDRNVELTGEPAMVIDAAWAERRYADEPEGDPNTIFQRRWALTLLEFTASTLQAEYAARGEEALFAELVPFAGFEPSDDARYASAARRAGRSSGAMRKAVFDFRTRQREVLRAILADTVLDPAETDSELTTLLCAIDAPGADAAPLPSGIQALRPEEVLARAMRSVRMSGVGGGAWQPPSDAEAALLFPQYEVLGLLGRGGMGAVYKARQLDLDRVVALKLLPLEVSADRDFADRFRREARAMAKLSHPHIITVFDFGTTSEGHLFFVMEFVEGANLHDMIRKVGFEPAQALSLVAQVCTALAYAHEKGIVHRDIKPANVMVDLEGQAKVADFGLARLTGAAAEESGQTVTGAVMGTPDYMAPEQKHGEHVDHRADIYSVGVMIYEMLCRETPQGAFDPPSKRVGCDPRIDKIVLKAMQQAPDRRYQTTQEMRVDVATALIPAIPKSQRRGVISQPLVPVEPVREKLPFFTTAFVAVLCVIGYIFYEKWTPSPEADAAAELAQSASGVASTSPPAADDPGSSTLEPPATAAALEAPATTPMPAAPKIASETAAPTPAAPKASAPAPTPAAPLSATGKWLAEQEPLWQAAYASEVRGPFEKGVADLKTQYRTALEKQLAAFAKAAKLDDAVAFRAERERMATAVGDVPAEDEAGTPAALKILRANYRTAFTKLDTERFTKAKSVHARYDTLLTQSQTALTQKQRFDEALEMKAKREALGAAWLIPAAGALPAAPTASGAAQSVRIPLSAATFRDGFTNILGMKFVPVKGTDVLFCVHETRRQDYAAYASQVSGVDGRWQNEQRDGISIGGENIHPAVGVSWDDAQAFCAWLSKLDGKTYRLPTDEEWSIAVGLGRLERRSKNTTPEMLSEKETTEYPWDGVFPPRTRDRAGNYADKAHQEKFPAGRWIDGYSDGFATTAPVMSFKPGKSGLYDLGGNVREWVDDWWNAAQQERAIRGSDWNSSGEVSYFLASYRSHHAASTRSATVGFRAVVETRLPAPVTSAPPKPGSAGAKDADGWEDLLARLTPAEVEKTGHGWSLKDGELFSPETKFAALPLPGKVAGTSYRLRVKLRRITGTNVFHVVLPVADRMCGFELEGRPTGGIHTGLSLVNGKNGKDLPGVVEGKQVNDTEPHELEVTVRLDGANATITTTLDAKPLYEWTGPTAALSQHPGWATTEPGALALGTYAGGWAVSEVKVKRLSPPAPAPAPAPTPAATGAAPAKPAAQPAPAADGWEDLLARLTPELVAQTGNGWSMKDGALHSPPRTDANPTLPLPGILARASYQVRVKVQAGKLDNGFRIVLPVGDHSVQFMIDDWGGQYTGLGTVAGKWGKDMPGIVIGRQIKDAAPHDLEVTVRLDGTNATVTTTLDARPLHSWTGPIAALTIPEKLALKSPGTLGLGAQSQNWIVSEVKVKLLSLPAPAPAPAVLPPPPVAADGWADLLARLTPALVEQVGNGWSLKDGAFHSPATKNAVLPLPGSFAGASYQVRVKLRQLTPKESFTIFLPVADRMVGFALDGWPTAGYFTGLNLVDGVGPPKHPDAIAGKLVKDAELHALEVTVRLDGADAKITARLDAQPVCEWAGPAASLSISPAWPIPPATLALGTMADDWVVSEVKVKRLDAGK